MTLEDAAKLLNSRLRGAPWLMAVGVGDHEGRPCIFLYVKSVQQDDLDFLKDGWHDFPVVIRKMGTPRLVSIPKQRE